MPVRRGNVTHVTAVLTKRRMSHAKRLLGRTMRRMRKTSVFLAVVLLIVCAEGFAIVAHGHDKAELDGSIAAISSTSITVNDASSHIAISAVIAPATVIRKGSRDVSTSELNVNDHVHVKAVVLGDTSLVAFEITVQQ